MIAFRFFQPQLNRRLLLSLYLEKKGVAESILMRKIKMMALMGWNCIKEMKLLEVDILGIIQMELRLIATSQSGLRVILY